MRLGAPVVEFHTGRYACNPVPRDGRPATLQDGFAFQGSKNRSRWSTLYTEIPRALPAKPFGPKSNLSTKNAEKLSTVPSSAEEKYNGGRDET